MMKSNPISEINNQMDWSSSSGSVGLESHSLYRFVLRYINKYRPKSVLELGCNDGRLLEHLRGQNIEVSGVDLQPSPLPYCAMHDLSQPYSSGRQYELVISTEVVEHLVDTDVFFKSILANLAPGGTAIISTPNLVSAPNRLLMLFGRIPRFCYMEYHVHMFHPRDLIWRAKRHFEEVTEHGSHVLLGMRHGRWCIIFEWLARIFPRFACHTILVLRQPIAS